MKYAALFLFILLFITTVFSASIPSPTSEFFVNDYANFLTASEADEVYDLFSNLQKETTAEAVLVIVPTVEDLTPQEYATQLGEDWGVGKGDVDNGVVVLYAVSEKKIFVATGYGMEGILPDSKLGRMLDEYYVPKRDANLISDGIIDFCYALSNEIILNKAEVGSTQPSKDYYDYNYEWTWEDYLFLALFFSPFIIFFIIIILAATGVIKGGKGGNWGGGFGGGSGGWSGGGGSFGGGGFSGGGGSFGGGGAGR